MDAHKQSLAGIQAQIAHFHSSLRPFRIFHGSTNSTRDFSRSSSNAVDCSSLDRILSVDTSSKTVIVEPNVPMDSLVEATLEHGLLPLVVMEFPGITVGGGFSGTSGESSSFRHGFFDTTVNWVEIVLADGTARRASRDENPDLFWGAASSFGSLGVVTMLELRLRDARGWVELTYHPAESMPSAMKVMQAETADRTVDFLDGMVFGRNEIVVCSGKLVDTPRDQGKVKTFTRRQDRWFYLHVQRKMRGMRVPHTEYVPIVDYLFRYDRGGFWVARWSYTYFLAPFNRVTRFLLDYFMHTRVMYRALHASGLSRRFIIQDVVVPYEATGEFHDWLDDNLGIYPVWLCPLRQRREEGRPEARHGLFANLADPDATPEFMMNFGVWGAGSADRKEFLRQNRLLEQKVDEVGGRKWLYAHCYYTEEEFWGIYDRESYDALRKKYGAGHLPSVYDKVKVDLEGEEKKSRESWAAWLAWLFWSIWPLAGLYGVYRAVVMGDGRGRGRRMRAKVE